MLLPLVKANHIDQICPPKPTYSLTRLQLAHQTKQQTLLRPIQADKQLPKSNSCCNIAKIYYRARLKPTIKNQRINHMQERTYHLLIVEDEPVTRTKLVGYFKAAGYEVSAAGNGEEMQRLLSRHHIDLLLLDISLPDADGLDLTMQLRKTYELGIILVTGRDTEVDRILGLEIGADDYVTKPFSERELLARVKSVLRRLSIQSTTLPQKSNLYFSGWKVNLTQRKITSPADEKVHLTRGEFELLSALIKHPKTVMSRDRLMALVTHRSWQPDNRTIDVLIKRLREKIEKDPKSPELLLTIYGEGYVLASEVSDSPEDQASL